MNAEPLSREEQIAEAKRVRDAACDQANAVAFNAAFAAANAYAATADADAAYQAELARINEECPA